LTWYRREGRLGSQYSSKGKGRKKKKEGKGNPDKGGRDRLREKKKKNKKTHSYLSREEKTMDITFSYFRNGKEKKSSLKRPFFGNWVGEE